MNTGSAMAAFERMEDKVVQLEARSQAAAELAGDELEGKFARLESSSVEDELAAMKSQLLGGAPQAQALPGTATSSTSTNASDSKSSEPAIDAELEDLKTKLDQL